MLQRVGPPALGIVASLTLHGLVMLGLGVIEAPRVPPAPVTVQMTLALEPPGAPGTSTTPGRPTDSAEWTAGGAHSPQNVDLKTRGERGDATGAAQVVLLASRDDGITLQDSALNNVRVGQVQRVASAKTRTSQEWRRATPQAAGDVYLAKGHGEHREQRSSSAQDAREGAKLAPDASLVGAEQTTHASMLDTAGALADQDLRAGGAQTSPGIGIQDGEGVRASRAAKLAEGQPAVDRSVTSTLASEHGSSRDDVDSELLAARMLSSLVEATARSAPEVGIGRGGVGGGGAPGSGGGVGVGGVARAYGPGSGAFDALDTSDWRYRQWFNEQKGRLGSALVFPRQRQLAMDQGTSVVRVTVRRDGSLAEPPRLLRSSGFDDLDRAALVAIRDVTPFPPLPTDLAPGLQEIRVTFPIQFSNPMVH